MLPLAVHTYLLAILFVLCLSCSGGSSATSSPAHGGRPADPAAGGGTPGAATPAPGPDRNAPPSEAACEKLLDHFIDLATAAHAATVSDDVAPTPEQVAAIRAKLAPQFIATCRQLDAATYDCELAATSEQDMLTCSDDTH